jgi:hypothetical protein
VAHLIEPQRMLARKPIAFCVVRAEDVFVGGAGLHQVYECDTADRMGLDLYMARYRDAAWPHCRITASPRRRMSV